MQFTGQFKCLNPECGFEFIHGWNGGDPMQGRNPKVFASTSCIKCEHLYIKRLHWGIHE